MTAHDARLIQRPAAILSLALPFGVALLVWAPQLRFDHVPETEVDAAAVERARREPADSVLDELRGLPLFPAEPLDSAALIAVADGILLGRLELPDLPSTTIHLPFLPRDLDGIEPGMRLRFAAWVVPELLLAAHAVTGREAYFAAARDYVRAWDAYEQSALRPRGYLWNDHATAARVRVLAEFWRQYRGRSDFDPAIGRAVLAQAARYRELLASPQHFTFATNHGMMENLALLQVEVGFPTLPRKSWYRAIALERLGRQLDFLLDQNGVIRENSAGYQSFGLEMLGQTFHSMALLGVTVPQSWSVRYRNGLAFLAALQRPDGTLPTYGDTDGAPQTWIPRESALDPTGASVSLRPWASLRPTAETTLRPGAGYWIEWSGLDRWPDRTALAQTVVTWTSPPGPAHKHADELSVLVWARGVSWLTNVGYWPYDLGGRDEAEGWSASNAPHAVDEATDSRRSARLLATGTGRALSLTDVERRGADGYLARRQVVFVKPDRWIVLDGVESGGRGTSTTWTLSPEVALGETPSGTYRLAAPSDTATLELLTSSGASIRPYRGSLSPFAGWQVVRGKPRPAHALVVEQGGGSSWSALVLALGRRGQGAAEVQPSRVVEIASPERWTIVLTRGADSVRVERAGDRVVVSRRGARGTRVPAPDTVRLAAAPDPAPELERIRGAYRAAALEYPQFEDLAGTRLKASFLVLGLFAGQETVVRVLLRRRRRWHVSVRLVSVLAWIAVAGWLHLSLLRSWVVLAS